MKATQIAALGASVAALAFLIIQVGHPVSDRPVRASTPVADQPAQSTAWEPAAQDAPTTKQARRPELAARPQTHPAPATARRQLRHRQDSLARQIRGRVRGRRALDEETLAFLLDALARARSVADKQAALDALRRGPRRRDVVSTVIGFLDTKEPAPVRIAALHTLEAISGDDALTAIRASLLSDPSAAVRSHAAMGLIGAPSTGGGNADSALLRSAISDVSRNVRVTAIEALYLKGNARALAEAAAASHEPEARLARANLERLAQPR